jgi:hypothetical protein
MSTTTLRLPRTATKKEIYAALGLTYQVNGRLRYRYRSINRDFFTAEYIRSAFGLEPEQWNRLRVLDYPKVKRICTDFDIIPEDFLTNP